MNTNDYLMNTNLAFFNYFLRIYQIEKFSTQGRYNCKHFYTCFYSHDFNLNNLFENKFLMRLFVPNRKEVTREWERIHNKELNDLYYSLNIVRVIKSRRMFWEGHEACIGDRRGIYTRFCWRNLREIKHLENPGIDVIVIFRSIFRNLNMRARNVSNWVRICTVVGYLLKL